MGTTQNKEIIGTIAFINQQTDKPQDYIENYMDNKDKNNKEARVTKGRKKPLIFAQLINRYLSYQKVFRAGRW